MVVDEALVGGIVVEEEGGDLANCRVETGVEMAVDESARETRLGRWAHHGDCVAVRICR